jgi:hypothetical protein
MEAGMPSFSLAFSYFMGLNKESVLFSKSNLSTSYRTASGIFTFFVCAVLGLSSLMQGRQELYH